MTNQEFIESISLEGEIWKDVIGFEGLYMISSFGRCISLERIIIDNNGILKYIGQKMISFNMVSGNYLQYRLWKNNKQYNMSIHRLVAIAHIPNPNQYPEVEHIDTNRTNNVVSNLRWATVSMNKLNPITRKRNSESKKGHTFTPVKAVVRINPSNPNDIKFYDSVSQTNKIDNFNASKVASVCRGERKLHSGYKWMFKSDYEALNKSKNESPDAES